MGYHTDPCTHVRKANVEEEERRVVVTLLDPERDPRQACIQLAVAGCVTVRLREPLGDRRVEDGSLQHQRFPQMKRGAERTPLRRFGRCRPVPVER
jgi:hypothetical protein